jgi:hypothetical protein
MRKKFLVLTTIFVIILAAVLFYNGYRLTPLDAAKANPYVEENSVPLEEVNLGWGKVYLFSIGKEFRTVMVLRDGFLWRAPYSAYFNQTSSDKINIVGSMNYYNKKDQVTVLFVETSDPNIAFVEIGPSNDRINKEIKVGTPIIFSWNRVIQTNELKPIALSKEGIPLYEYRYPKNKKVTDQIISNGPKWYPVNEN